MLRLDVCRRSTRGCKCKHPHHDNDNKKNNDENDNSDDSDDSDDDDERYERSPVRKHRLSSKIMTLITSDWRVSTHVDADVG